MKIAEVVNQIRTVLPKYSDAFSKNISDITSIVASGGVATITTNLPHQLSDGNLINASNFLYKNEIESITFNGLVATIKTVNPHDLTLNWPEHEYVEFSDFADSTWNGKYKLEEVPNRNTFKIKTNKSSPASFGNLLENRIDAVTGLFGVVVVDENTFQIEGEFLDGDYSTDGTVATNIRVASTIDIERAIEEYTKQGEKDFWIFIEPVDAVVSKDRSTFSDAVASRANGVDIRTRIVDGFSLYIIGPSSNEIAGEVTLDIFRHDMLLPLMRTLYGVNFSSGLNTESTFKNILTSHGVFAYTKAFVVYRYMFQTIFDLTDADAVTPMNTRAFRNINSSIQVGTQSTEDYINLDESPE